MIELAISLSVGKWSDFAFRARYVDYIKRIQLLGLAYSFSDATGDYVIIADLVACTFEVV
jgi:hypothetical protein